MNRKYIRLEGEKKIEKRERGERDEGKNDEQREKERDDSGGGLRGVAWGRREENKRAMMEGRGYISGMNVREEIEERHKSITCACYLFVFIFYKQPCSVLPCCSLYFTTSNTLDLAFKH